MSKISELKGLERNTFCNDLARALFEDHVQYLSIYNKDQQSLDTMWAAEARERKWWLGRATAVVNRLQRIQDSD